ncbi:MULTISPECIES: helix-turn-helix domain-containing protein [Bacteroidales]|uniref:helix-turn-helix domain-containing protein n=1 Tax=Bacteroidales TaxID=171549 RepID=UPI0013D3339C|nr:MULTISPECIES: helix-turn-helix domain-containing protein [Bacteroidales]NDV82258.1 DNA-binding protein [Bacteroides sp. 51]NDV97536.1 DNA-binding protein [Dysgonomonas sp. 521]
MDIIAIEKESFDSFKKKLERIASLVPKRPSNNTLCIEQEWIEGKELAASLNLPPRRLQHLRESGTLSFSTIGKKIYYRISEVKSLLEQGKINSK